MKNWLNLNIHDLTWKISFVEGDHEKLDGACGVTYKTDLEIYINKDLKYNLLKRTIVHELTHAFIWSFGFENNVARDFQEEDVCNLFESYGKMILETANYVMNEFDNMEGE